MPVIATVLQVGRHRHLTDAAGRKRSKGLQLLDSVLVPARYDPPRSHPRRDGLGEARAIHHGIGAVERLERLGTPWLEHQLPIDIVFDDRQPALGHHRHQLALSVFRHGGPHRITGTCGKHQGLDRPFVRCLFQGLKAQTGVRIGGNLDHFQSQQIAQLNQAVVTGRLGRNQVTRVGHAAQTQLDRLDTTVGDHDIGRINNGAGIAHANGNLPPQGLVARTEDIAIGPLTVKSGDLAHLLMQSTQGQILARWHCRPEGYDALTARLVQDFADDAAAGHGIGLLYPGNRWCGRRQGRRVVHEIARLRTCTDQALILQGRVGVQNRCVADALLGTQLAHRGYALTGLVEPLAYIIGQLPGDLLV